MATLLIALGTAALILVVAAADGLLRRRGWFRKAAPEFVVPLDYGRKVTLVDAATGLPLVPLPLAPGEFWVPAKDDELVLLDRAGHRVSESSPVVQTSGVATPDEQPAPTKNAHPAVWDLVVADMTARDKLGEKRYGTRLQPFNGRDSLRDAYEEALDLVVYLRTALFEKDGK